MEILTPINKIKNLGNEIDGQGWGGGEISLYLSRDLVAGIIIKLTQERLKGNKETKFNACTQRSHRNRTEDMAEWAAFILLDKEKIREQLTRQNNLGFK